MRDYGYPVGPRTIDMARDRMMTWGKSIRFHHRADLAQLYEQTQQALAAGDLDRLVVVSAPARQAEVDAILANFTHEMRCR